ncbi:hypothetical protein SDC9_166185 [bioreactor metagenome]|uniref:Uncharacterized protein n=1 Tax=bioreactor metagenome TaxID=1076179 RepID=A0A645FYU3_9ZZZZ
MANGRQIDMSPFDQIEESPRGGDKDINLAAKVIYLHLSRDASKNSGLTERRMFSIGGKGGFDLHCQLARWC